MNKIIIATIKDWNIENANFFRKKFKNTIIISKKKDLISRAIKRHNPDYIFFPHWSWVIPKNIYSVYNCIAFHMTDLPFGRGGSPLQNLIARGIKQTKISAIEVVGGLDAGPVYTKQNLSLNGTAEQIYRRASKVIFTRMIPALLKNAIQPKKQSGKVVYFKRRKPGESNIGRLNSKKEIYDYIRMLDASGYPPAFLEKKNLRLKLNRAKFQNDRLISQVEIEVKNAK